MESKSLITIGKLLSVCISLAAEGGKIIRDIHASGKLGTKFKGISYEKIFFLGYDDPCTQADLSVQKLYTLGLNQYFPGIKIIGEENPSEALKMEINESEILKRVNSAIPAIESHKFENPNFNETWQQKIDIKKLGIWVDPLDGTKDYTVGDVQFVTSLIGITIDFVPRYGVIHRPFLEENHEKSATFFGGQNLGVNMLHDGKFTVLPKIDESTRKNLVLLGTKSHYSETVKKIIEALKPDSIRRIGGAGNKILELITGGGDCYVFPSYGMKPWDTCAGEALLREIGGNIKNCAGEQISYEKPHNIRGLVCARTHELVEKLLIKLKEIKEVNQL